MLDYKNIEDDLEIYLNSIEKEINIINENKENLIIIQNELNINKINIKTLNLQEFRMEIENYRNLNENIEYLEFYQSLIKLDDKKINEETKLNQLNNLTLIVRIKNLFLA